MTDKPDVPRDATVSDTVERIRAARFDDIDRGLVLELMSLHAAHTAPENLGRQIDDEIMAQIKGRG